MKFKYGIFIGFFSGFALGALAENLARKKIEGSIESAAIHTTAAVYSKGWLEGKTWAIALHKANHPDCDLCPH